MRRSVLILALLFALLSFSEVSASRVSVNVSVFIREDAIARDDSKCGHASQSSPKLTFSGAGAEPRLIISNVLLTGGSKVGEDNGIHPGHEGCLIVQSVSLAIDREFDILLNDEIVGTLQPRNLYDNMDILIVLGIDGIDESSKYPVLGISRDQSVSGSTPEALQPLLAPRDGYFYTPLATSVESSGYMGPHNDSFLNAPLLFVDVFQFESAKDALLTFEELPDQIDAWKESEPYFQNQWYREVTVGQVGDDRFGYLHRDGDSLRIVVLEGDLIVHYWLSDSEPVPLYEDTILPFLESEGNAAPTLEDLPPGWSLVEGPSDSSPIHIGE